MKSNKIFCEKQNLEKNDKTTPKYESPKVISYSGDDLLKELGPAQACQPNVLTIGC